MSEPPPKRRKMEDAISTSLPEASESKRTANACKSSFADSDDEELQAAIRLSLEAASCPEETTSSRVAAPLTSLQEVRMLQRQKYEQAKLSGSYTNANHGMLHLSRSVASGRPRLLNEEGTTIFQNKLFQSDPINAIDLKTLISSQSLESGIVSGAFDEALQELFYFFPRSLKLSICTKPVAGPSGIPVGLLALPPAWNMVYSSSLVHAKFMILFFPDYLRVVVASGNFTQIEYDQMRQVFWYQDFPKLRAAPVQAVPFALRLTEFLIALSVPQSSVDMIKCFDFSRASATLVTSIPANGSTVAPKSGLTQLKQFTSTLPPLSDDVCIVAQANTVSLASDAWLKEFVEACGRSPRSGGAKLAADKLKIVYPTKTDFLAANVAGDAFSVVLFKNNFPRNRFFRCADISQQAILLHSKVYYPESASWIYIGSHNLTKSAWGSSKTEPTNFELGIIFSKQPEGTSIPFWLPLKQFGPEDEVGGTVRNWDPSNR